MYAIDLQLAGFVVLLVVVAFCGLVILLRQRSVAIRTYPAQTWQVYEALPFGIVITDPALNEPIFLNRQARRLLASTNGNSEADLQKILGRMTGPEGAEPRQQTGLIHQPVFLRWWSYVLEGGEKLLVLAEAADQQRFLRQQAFVGQLVHELRTPLTALVAHAELVASPRTGEAVRQASVQTLQSGAQRMARLVRDMLELYRMETADDLTLQPVNLVLIAEDAIAQVILRAEDCGVTLDFEAETPHGWCLWLYRG